MKESMYMQTANLNGSPQALAYQEPQEVSDADQHRAGAYRLLAGVLRTTPSPETLEFLAGFAAVDSEADEIAIALNMLGMAAEGADLHQVDDEFHALFIGLGRGELVPYASWYQTGFLMERPLGDLRDDLKALGFERDEQVSEPEDHVAALCEVMSMLIEDGTSQSVQAEFFNRHISQWIDRFFNDLINARTASFYRSVGRLGLAFFAFENRYLAMQV